MENQDKRLNKYISETGFCSRRMADQLIEEQRVTINGQIPALGTRVKPTDVVCVDGQLIRPATEQWVYIAFNKPRGITCTTELDVKDNIIQYINHPQRIFPIGRLDKPSEGLIFLTNDGDIVNKILRAGNQHEKEYFVTVDKPVTADFIQKMRKGVPILDTVTQPCYAEQVDKFEFKIILTQGLNRQIRRMCQFLGYEVKKLKRTRIMHVTLKGLATGQWRNLTEQELALIHEKVKTSSKTEEASFLQSEIE